MGCHAQPGNQVGLGFWWCEGGLKRSLTTIIVQHYNCAMKNITIKLENEVAHWSKVWAAEHNTSVSRILGDLLKQMKKEKTGYAKAMGQFLNVEAQALKVSKGYPLRDDLHGR